MGSKLLINGLIYSPGKEIVSFEFSGGGSGGGIRVDWGNDDVVLLPGENWSESTFLKGGRFEYSKYRAHWLSGSAKCTYISAVRAVNTTRGQVAAWGSSSSSGYPAYADIDWSDLTTTQNQDRDPNANWVYENGSEDTRCSGGLRRRPCRRNGVLIGTLDTCASVSTYFETRIGAYQITSNTGASTRRETITPPQVSRLPGNCLLTINFTDGTTKELIYGEVCPDVRPIEDELCPGLCSTANQIIEVLSR